MGTHKLIKLMIHIREGAIFMISTIVICAVLLAICVYAVISYRKKIKSGCCGSGGDAVKRVRPKDTKAENYAHKVDVYISGMTCENCAARVENAFNEKDGFMAKVNLRKKCAEIWCKSEPDENELRQTVMRSGYSPMRIVHES